MRVGADAAGGGVVEQQRRKCRIGTVKFKKMLETWAPIDYNESVKESTHSKSGCPQLSVKCPYEHRPSCGQTGWAFSVLSVSLVEKGKKRYNQTAKRYQ